MPYLILGDPAYPLMKWLMKNFPYTSATTKEQDSFNAYINKGRVVVEMAFGRLKGRWRRLMKKMDVNVNYAPTIILACCVLHNIVEFNKEDCPEKWLDMVRTSAQTYPQPEETGGREENHTRSSREDKTGEEVRNALLEVTKEFPLIPSLTWRVSRY